MSGPLLPLNGLTVCYMALPTIVGTFLKHCIPPKDSHPSTRPELKLDEALSVARSMTEKLSQYPIEDVQRLANAFQPAPWNVRVIRVSIPASTCLSAAEYLINAFGPLELQHVIGGRQWWQLRSNKDGSVEGEWIAMKRDLPRSPSAPPSSASPSKLSPSTLDSHFPTKSPQTSHPKQKSLFDSLRSRRSKSPSTRNASSSTPASSIIQTASPEPDPSLVHEAVPSPRSHSLDPVSAQGPTLHIDQLSPSSEQGIPGDPYEDDLDQMPCMLYIHGGAYYFGSVNTHRYTIWRYARKMGGRAFAVNYRHAPQYPFPCALADCLAAYLNLIQPPEGAKHRATDPSKIVIAGDSAGGGLSLALLTLIRDVGLPLPAGAVLISPWVDLTHSFPSVMSNTDTDIMPPYGFMHQPSVLWPPPSSTSSTNSKKTSPSEPSSQPSSATTNASSNTTSVEYQNPYKLQVSSDLKIRKDESNETTPVIEFDDGEEVVMNQQIQFYATNDQLTHPYCSPLFSPSLGGLPPLLIIAGQNEVLRDEIIYMAHRAAHPDRYPLREDLLNANPERKAKADKYPPTQVHLQVYDDMFHVLPLFSFLRPAKYCYRAIGSFCKFVTGPLKETCINSSVGPSESYIKPVQNINVDSSGGTQSSISHTSQDLHVSPINAESSSSNDGCSPGQLPTPPSSSAAGKPAPVQRMSIAELPRIKPEAAAVRSLSSETLSELKHTIYHALLPHQRPDFKDGMIRERVALDGKIRPLEDESELSMLQILPEELGRVKAGPLKRWAQGRKIFNDKFIRRRKKIQLERELQIKRSNKRVKKSFNKISKSGPPQKNSRKSTPQISSSEPTSNSPPEIVEPTPPPPTTTTTESNNNDNVEESSIPEIIYGCFLSEEERPPPCSVAARRDNVESLKLAKRQHRLSKSFFVPPSQIST